MTLEEFNALYPPNCDLSLIVNDWQEYKAWRKEFSDLPGLTAHHWYYLYTQTKSFFTVPKTAQL